MASPRELPLRGIRVIELGEPGTAAALAMRLLAEQGADVVRIGTRPGAPGGSSLAGCLSASDGWPRVDPTSEAGFQEAMRMVRDADVAISSFRKGAATAPWADPRAAGNDRAVILRFAGPHTEAAAGLEAAAIEGLLGARCGLFTDVNILRRVLGLPPVFTALPHASVYAAVHGAVAVALALLARETSGRGDTIEVDLVAAGVSAMGSAVLDVAPQPRRYDLPEWPRLVSRLALPALRPLLGRLPEAWQRRVEARGETAVPALMSSYACADGARLYVFAVDHDRLPQRLLEALGLWDRLRAEGLALADPYAPGTSALRNNVADSTRLSRRWQTRLQSALAECFARRPAAEWEATLSALGIPCAMHRPTREWMRLPQLEQAGIVERGSDGQPSPGPVAWVSAARGPAPPVPASPTGPRLAGRLVLDLSSMVAGPVCGRTLAEYGAEVIKLDSPRPHHGPRLTCWYGVDVNQGKRSALLDLAAPEGRAVFDRLLARADVVLHNFSDAVCARLRLDAATLDAAKPGIVVARIGAFRGPRPGPWDERKGYDPVLQAASGIMLRYGGGRPVHHGIASCVDYLTGYLAAWAVTLGLLRRARTGCGGEVATSLAQAATLIQLPFALREDGAPEDEPSGQWAWGTHALARLYRARDGWIFLAAAPGARGAVCASLGLHAGASDAAFAAALRRETRAMLAKRLAGQALVAPVDPLDRLPAAPADPPGTPIPPGGALRAVLSRGPGGEAIRTLAPGYVRSDAAPLIQLAPAPRLGADTRAILAEAGLDAEAIARMIGAGIASDGVSDRLLPG